MADAKLDKVVKKERKAPSLLTLPMEVLVHIATFFTTTRDKVRLRHVSRTLRSVMETPSLWSEFVWPQYDSKEEECICNMFKWCGVYIKRLSFPDGLPQPLKLVEMLWWCCNVVELQLKTTSVHEEYLPKGLEYTKQLKKLDVQWNDQLSSLLTISSSLKELTVRLRIPKAQQYTLQASLVAFLQKWTTQGCKPQNLNIVYHRVRMYMRVLLSEWTQWNSHATANNIGHLKLYSSYKVPLDLFTSVPVFQLQFGKNATCPFLNASKFELVELGTNLILNCSHGNTVVHKAVVWTHSNTVPWDMALQVGVSLIFVTDFNVSCASLRCNHLELISIICPNLQRLNLQNSTNCLTSLKGLHAIASCCHHLEGLNLLGINFSQVENHINKLWVVLSNMKLTHLAIELCNTIVLPVHAQNCASLYHKCSTLKALHLKGNDEQGCLSCKNYDDDCLLLISHFPSLVYCSLDSIPSRCVNAIKNILIRCKHVEYFSCSLEFTDITEYPDNNNFDFQLFLSFPFVSNLQQLYISSLICEVPDKFLSTVSAHGGLVHVILCVFTVTYEGTLTLIENSPNLLTLHIVGAIIVKDDFNSVAHFKAMIKEKSPPRKLFTVGSFELHRSMNTYDNCDLFHTVDVLSLWK